MPENAKQKLLKLIDKIPLDAARQRTTKSRINQLNDEESQRALEFFTSLVLQMIRELEVAKSRLAGDERAECEELIKRLHEAIWETIIEDEPDHFT